MDPDPILTDSATALFDGVKTIPDMARRGLAQGPDAQCLGWRSVDPVSGEVADSYDKWITYQEVADRARWFASGILHLQLCPKNSEG